jgi:hypothetical protein
MLRAVAFQTLSTMGEATDPVGSQDLMFLAKALKDVSSASRINVDTELLLRKVRDQAKAAAAEVTKTIKQAGLSDETVQQIKARILGIGARAVSNLQELLTLGDEQRWQQLQDSWLHSFGMRQSGVLLPYQQRWVADTSKVKVCEVAPGGPELGGGSRCGPDRCGHAWPGCLVHRLQQGHGHRVHSRCGPVDGTSARPPRRSSAVRRSTRTATSRRAS